VIARGGIVRGRESRAQTTRETNTGLHGQPDMSLDPHLLLLLFATLRGGRKESSSRRGQGTDVPTEEADMPDQLPRALRMGIVDMGPPFGQLCSMGFTGPRPARGAQPALHFPPPGK